MRMVVDGVAAADCSFGLVGGQCLRHQLGRGPHRQRLIGELPGAFLDRGFVPSVEQPSPALSLRGLSLKPPVMSRFSVKARSLYSSCSR